MTWATDRLVRIMSTQSARYKNNVQVKRRESCTNRLEVYLRGERYFYFFCFNPLILIKNTFYPIIYLFKVNRNVLNYLKDFQTIGQKECLLV